MLAQPIPLMQLQREGADRDAIEHNLNLDREVFADRSQKFDHDIGLRLMVEPAKSKGATTSKWRCGRRPAADPVGNDGGGRIA